MKILAGVDTETWWDVARACDYATFFHTPLWQEIARAVHLEARDGSFEARLDDGTRAVFPLLIHPRALFRAFGDAESTWAGCYGGAIADGALESGQRRALYAAADRTRGRVVLNGNPLVADDVAPSGFETTEDSTHLLSIDRPLDDLIARFSKGHRASLAAGRRNGVVTRRAESLGDYRRYFDVYRSSLDRWGERATSRYPWRLFERGHELAERYPDQVALWLAEVDGEAVAGAWVFGWNRHVVYWHGASNDAGRQVSATTVILVDVIADAQRRGFAWFDFNPSGGHAGVAAFKRRFDAEEVPFHRYRRVHPPVRQLLRAVDLLRQARR